MSHQHTQVRTINEIIADIRANPFASRADIERGQDDVKLLLYMRRERQRYTAPTQPPISATLACEQCNARGSLFRIGARWLCAEHIPTDITFPVGLHGEAFAAFQARRDK